jgi:hypothetical protein
MPNGEKRFVGESREKIFEQIGNRKKIEPIHEEL